MAMDDDCDDGDDDYDNGQCQTTAMPMDDHGDHGDRRYFVSSTNTV